MHELTLAQSVIELVIEETRKKRARQVTEMVVDAGELMQLDLNVLRFSLRTLGNSSVLKRAKIRVHLVRATFECRRCKQRWTMKEALNQLSVVPDSLLIREPKSKEMPLHFMPYLYATFLKCPACSSSDINVTSGKDIRIAKLSME